MIKPIKPNTNEEKTQSNTEQNKPLTFTEIKAKPYKLSNYLIQNSFIDALDSNGCWRIARIIKKTGDLIKVTFEGWSHRWDEVNKIF